MTINSRKNQTVHTHETYNTRHNKYRSSKPLHDPLLVGIKEANLKPTEEKIRTIKVSTNHTKNQQKQSIISQFFNWTHFLISRTNSFRLFFSRLYRVAVLSSHYLEQFIIAVKRIQAPLNQTFGFITITQGAKSLIDLANSSFLKLPIVKKFMSCFGLIYALRLVQDVGTVLVQTFFPNAENRNKSVWQRFVNAMDENDRAYELFNDARWFAINLCGILLSGGAINLGLTLAGLALDLIFETYVPIRNIRQKIKKLDKLDKNDPAIQLEIIKTKDELKSLKINAARTIISNVIMMTGMLIVMFPPAGLPLAALVGGTLALFGGSLSNGFVWSLVTQDIPKFTSWLKTKATQCYEKIMPKRLAPSPKNSNHLVDNIGDTPKLSPSAAFATRTPSPPIKIIISKVAQKEDSENYSYVPPHSYKSPTPSFPPHRTSTSRAITKLISGEDVSAEGRSPSMPKLAVDEIKETHTPITSPTHTRKDKIYAHDEMKDKMSLENTHSRYFLSSVSKKKTENVIQHLPRSASLV